MIRFAANNDINGFISLWREAFGDSAEEIRFFLDNKFKPENTLIYDEYGEIASMLFLLDGKMCISGKDYPSYYLYAACTAPKYRGRGIMSALLKAAEKTASDRNIRYICLLPAEDSLYDYYSRFGYQTAFSKKILTVTRDEITEESNFVCDEAQINNLEKLRENAFNGIDRFKWSNDAVNFAFEHTKMYGGNHFITCKGYALYSEIDDKMRVKEYAFTPAELTKTAAFLMKKHGTDKISFALPYNFECSIGKTELKRGGMILPIDFDAENLINNIKNAYLGLTLD